MSDILSGRQAKAIDALMTGATMVTAAERAGVSTRTLQRWRQSPGFHAELQRRSTEILDDTTRRLTAVMAASPKVLHDLMTAGDSPPGVRLAAARIALDSGLKLIELNDVLRRLDILERQR